MISLDVEKSPGGHPHERRSTTARTGGAVARAVAIVFALTAAITVIAIAFALPAARSKPHDVPIGTAGPQAEQVAALVRQDAPGAFRVTPYTDEASLRAAIRNRDEYGGLALGAAGPTLLTASGASPTVAQLLTQFGNGVARRAGMPLRTEDLAPPTSADPRGAGLSASVLPITLAGLLPAIALVLLLPRRPLLRLVALLAFSVLAAGVIAVVLRNVLGAIDQNVAAVAAGLLLGLLGSGLAVLALGSLFGRAGLNVGSSLALLLGNPLSGLTSAPEMLPRGWGTFGQYLPQGATATLLRSTAFFDGAGAGRAIAVLTGWATGGAILLALAALKNQAPQRNSDRLEPAAVDRPVG